MANTARLACRAAAASSRLLFAPSAPPAGPRPGATPLAGKQTRGTDARFWPAQAADNRSTCPSWSCVVLLVHLGANPRMVPKSPPSLNTPTDRRTPHFLHIRSGDKQSAFFGLRVWAARLLCACIPASERHTGRRFVRGSHGPGHEKHMASAVTETVVSGAEAPQRAESLGGALRVSGFCPASAVRGSRTAAIGANTPSRGRASVGFAWPDPPSW